MNKTDQQIEQTEIFKDIPDYEGHYQCSNLGNIKSLKNNLILKYYITKKGYKEVYLSKDNIKKNYHIHILVAITFLNHKQCGYIIVVDHINNNKLHNNVNNLQLITHRENASKDQFRKNRSSDFIGVCYFKRDNNWRARIYFDGKARHICYCDNEIDAFNSYLNVLNKTKKGIDWETAINDERNKVKTNKNII